MLLPTLKNMEFVGSFDLKFSPKTMMIIENNIYMSDDSKNL
jgi:hypothetical protein